MSAQDSETRLPVYVWEAPVRLWHWIVALATLVLMLTGYLIGSPPASTSGEASEQYLMAYIRFAHFCAAYAFTWAFLLRVYWAFVGNCYSREMFLVPVFMLRRDWWAKLFRLALYYLLIGPGELHVGHNVGAMASYFFMYVLGTVFMVVTGFALYGEALGYGSWAYTLFSSWVIPLLGQSQDVHTWHRFGMWYLIIFTIVHLYLVVREDLLSGVTVINSMFSGYREYKK